MKTKQPLILEIFTKAITSKWLPIAFLINVIGTGFLFPATENVAGYNAHTSDAIAGFSAVIVLFLARKIAKTKPHATLSLFFIGSTVVLATLCAAGFSGFYTVLQSPNGSRQGSFSDLFIFAPVSLFGQIFTFAIFVGALKYATHTSHVLAEERLALRLIQENLRQDIEDNRKELIDLIETNISPVVTLLESDLKNSHSTSATIENIHLAIADVVRPLSHQLDEQVNLKSIGELDRSQIARQIRRSSATHKLNRVAPLSLSVSPVISMILFCVFDLISLLYLFDLEALYAVGAPFMTMAIGIFWISRRFWGSRKAKAIQVLSVGVFVGVLLGTVFTLIGTSRGYDPELITPIGFSVFLITIGGSWFELALDRTRESRRGAEIVNIEIARSISEVRQKLWYLRKRIARELHGGLQAKLQVLALQINNNQSVDPESLVDFYQEMKRSIAAESTDESTQSLEEYLKDLNEFWSGIASINASLTKEASEATSGNIVLNECLREIIREAINNAIKHAGASEISISVAQVSDSQIKLVVSNNITKESSNASSASLGSKIFEELSDSWKLEVGVETSTLTAIFGTYSHIN